MSRRTSSSGWQTNQPSRREMSGSKAGGDGGGGGRERIDPSIACMPRLCDGCGLPARPPSVPLRRCSKCRSGWYHDQECQKRHHLLHRKTCSKYSTSSVRVRVVARPPPTGNALVMTFRTASSSSTGGGDLMERGGTRTSVLGVFGALVPPVVTTMCRQSRCVWCLTGLPRKESGGVDTSAEHRPRLYYEVPNLLEAWLCGPGCERAVMGAPPISSSAVDPSSDVAATLLRLERDAVLKLHDARHNPPMYLPTALLLFRMLVASCLSETDPRRRGGGTTKGHVNWDAQISCLAERPPQSSQQRERVATESRPDRHGLMNDNSDDDDDGDDEMAHEEAVVRTVQGMCHALLLHQSSSSAESTAASTYFVDPAKIVSLQSTDNIRQLLRRIKANAFGIRHCVDDASTLVPNDIGIGIFHVAHFANHSCCPNSEAVYRIEPGRLPRLSLQLLLPSKDRPVPAPHDEITVSYVSDLVLGLPGTERRRHIYRQFGFLCECTKCRSGN